MNTIASNIQRADLQAFIKQPELNHESEGEALKRTRPESHVKSQTLLSLKSNSPRLFKDMYSGLLILIYKIEHNCQILFL